MRTPPTSDADVATVYAAHRVSLVRLAFLLGGNAALAESLVQDAFLGLQRRGGRSGDPGSILSSLQAAIVARARRTVRDHASQARPSALLLRPAKRSRKPRASVLSRTAAGLEDLPPRLREVVVLRLWAGLGVRPAAAVLATSERAVTAALDEALSALGGSEPRLQTQARITEALHAQAYRIGAAELRSTFGDVLAEDARRTARQRRWWLTGVAAVVVAALVLAGVTAWTRRSVVATPAPPPTTAPTTLALSSPALAPGERSRSDIPWSQVGPGWVVVATSSPPDAVTETLLLVSPDGIRYPVGTSPEGIKIHDVSADGHTVLVGAGSEAQEWDLVAGTSRVLGAPYGWKTMRYAGSSDNGYLVLSTDRTWTVRLERWTADGQRRSDFPVSLASLSGSPGTPGVVLQPQERLAVLSLREGGLLDLDVDRDTIGRLPQPAGAAGCEPRSRWSPTEVAVVCENGPFVVSVTGSASRALLSGGDLSSPAQKVAGVWRSTTGALLQTRDPCSTTVATVSLAGQAVPLSLPEPAAGLVPNAVVGNRLYLGGTQCTTDGSRLVAYDLVSGQGKELVGEGTGRRTVRGAVVIPSAD